jgi:hypothetical protein
MKRIIQKTKELIAAIEKAVESRNKFYASHGDRWHESQEGREYAEETERLSEMLNHLNDGICELTDNE